jgi:2,3-dihydroxybenzoate decarboxylase
MSLKKIALEEHLASPETLKDSLDLLPREIWPKFRQYLLDVHGQLLVEMDATGIEMSVLSINSPAIQGIISTQHAVELARRCNDHMAEQVIKAPTRFQAFAALPMQDPEVAARELHRCVSELGFCGALVNSFSQVGVEDSAVYYDLPQYWGFWGEVEKLRVPFYLHPRDPLESRTTFLEGHPWLRSAAWAFTLDTATHALRLMGSGLFDKYPGLNIILGHLGETLPFLMWRVTKRVATTPRGVPAKKPMRDYFQNNFYVTTSGNFCTETLANTIAWLGADRILFAVDYPFEQVREATAWFDQLTTVSREDLAKIASGNARKLLRLEKQAKAAAR